MRIPMALVIYVSLTAVGFCGTPDWATTHAAGLAAARNRKYDEAIQCFKQTWSLSRTAEERGVSANDLGQTYRQLGRAAEAKEWLEQAYEVWKANPWAVHNLVVAASSLGDLYHDTGDYGRAERFLREAILTPDQNPASADMIRNDLADLLPVCPASRNQDLVGHFFAALVGEDTI